MALMPATLPVAAGFLAEPPAWMLVVLWLSLGYVVLRTTVVGLLHTGVVQAWLLARLHGIPLGLPRIANLALHGTDVKRAIRCCILAKEADADFGLDDVVRHEHAGGDPERVATALLAARHAGSHVPLSDLLSADLRGENPLARIRRPAANEMARES